MSHFPKILFAVCCLFSTSVAFAHEYDEIEPDGTIEKAHISNEHGGWEKLKDDDISLITRDHHRLECNIKSKFSDLADEPDARDWLSEIVVADARKIFKQYDLDDIEPNIQAIQNNLIDDVGSDVLLKYNATLDKLRIKSLTYHDDDLLDN